MTKKSRLTEMSVYFLNLFSKIIESSEILFIFVKENYSSIIKL